MASPVGHSLAGLCIYALTAFRGRFSDVVRDWPVVLFFAFLANLPDVDFLLGLVLYGRFNILHGTLTHSLLFLLGVSLVVSRFRFMEASAARRAWIAAALIGSHDLIDAFASQILGPHPAYGIEFFYPFSRKIIAAPFTLFYGVRHSNLGQLLSVENIRTVLYEVAVFGSLLMVIVWLRRRPDASPSGDSGMSKDGTE